MDESKYLKDRFDDQINWYDSKSLFYQKIYRVFHLLLIVSAVSILFIQGYISEKLPALTILSYEIDVLIRTSTDTLSLNKFLENWIFYRTTYETFRHKKYLFLTKRDN